MEVVAADQCADGAGAGIQCDECALQCGLLCDAPAAAFDFLYADDGARTDLRFFEFGVENGIARAAHLCGRQLDAFACGDLGGDAFVFRRGDDDGRFQSVYRMHGGQIFADNFFGVFVGVFA